MSPSWITPETAVATIEDLLALLMSGYTVELVPLDLIGPDRALLRLTGPHGEGIEPHEVRIATMRGLGDGVRQLRQLALGADDPDDVRPSTGVTSDAGGLPLGLMAAMMGMGGGIPAGAAGSSSETDQPRQVRSTNPAAMAEAITAALRPARTLPGADEVLANDTPSS